MPKKADTKKSTAKKTPAKKTATKKAPAKKAPAKKAPAKKAPAKKVPAKKAATKKVPAKKAPAKKVSAKKAPAKKIASRKRATPISSYKGRKGEKYMSAAMKKHFNAVLIDWQCCAIGDPSEDIACALSPAMHHLYGEGTLDLSTRRNFIKFYGNKEIAQRYHLLGHLYHARIAAYCLWRVRHGDQDYEAAFCKEKNFLDTIYS